MRGQNNYYTGYEYDGVPVNRAFDNYNGSTEPSLGVQELPVFPGGGPSSVASTALRASSTKSSRPERFPALRRRTWGSECRNFTTKRRVRFGGSIPDRTFSYYVGLLGYNQTYRFIDNSNGGGYAVPGGIFSGNLDDQLD